MPDAAVGLGSRIGRYFSVVSVLPALFLVVWTAALVTSGAWHSRPDLSLMVSRLGGLNLSGAAWLILITILVALFLHPLQLGMTRLLEGYWGSSRAATFLRRRITHHRKRLARLEDREMALIGQLENALDDMLTKHRGIARSSELTAGDLTSAREAMFESDFGHRLSGLQAAIATIPHSLARYPRPDRIMPTRLGNVLRSAEDAAGKRYELDTIRTASHIALVAPENHLTYLDDARQQLDTSARLCVVALLVTLETAVFLLPTGWWLLLAIAPYSLAYIAYRASIAAAGQYMGIVSTVMDLNRFKFYEALHIELPRNPREERANNRELMRLLKGAEKVRVFYKHPTGTPGTGAPPPTPPGNP
ncbi:Uncharacterised protein [Amycolatopsis camponoti]|uniref:Uncharacterized protein n=1 Tax=Amycolatopsis camponoti TaxID=2606593 RepID=A0A6I8LI68_9PSEU|nr:hypothetical protein [Amycolatopsis camponoti]VVJ16662.1 Uncharacterised protein [Amycolatopsis camponoti]